MSSSTSSLVDRTKKWIKLLTRRSQPPAIHPDEKTGGGFFTNAEDIKIDGGNFIHNDGGNITNEVNVGNIINGLKINYINEVVSGKQAVFELLEPYTCLDAAKDSSARHPPPRCHPETRLKIRERLMKWLSHEYDGWKMLWVRGSAGTGKSAVAQSFGDSCEETKKHGASYFFSRTAGRNKLETVVPTIVCQLATTIPEYRSLVGHQLANNPFLLRKSLPVQFRELIVEPFATLRLRQPIVIILDGLDECEGENAQLEILEMITNSIRTNPDLPLRWLIFSRPEAHLKNAFSLNSACGREELIIDDECRENVERYVKDRLAQIKGVYTDVMPSDWPPVDKLQDLLDAVSGLFVFASTCLNFIGDRDKADPISQLDSLLTFMRRSQSVLSRNPLAALDLLYSRILEKIPVDVYETTRRILAYMSHQNKVVEQGRLDSAQGLSNFLRLDRHAFYKATRGLHSVTSIPEPEDADKSQIRFYHASFQDSLLDPNRFGKFCISEQDALAVILPLCVHWCDVDVTHFHTEDGWNIDYEHKHDCVPGLTWASDGNQLQFSLSITNFFEYGVFDHDFLPRWECVDPAFLSQMSNLEIRFWAAINLAHVALLCQLDPSTSLVRAEPSSRTDQQLLEYMNVVIAQGITKPAQLPLRNELPGDEWIREYFFMGQGVNSVIVWRTNSPTTFPWCAHSLRCDQEPSELQISKYAKHLRDIRWDEAKAKAEMK